MSEITRKYTIAVRGATEEEVEAALAEALRRIRAGNTSGHDRNEDSGFYFEVEDDLPPDEVPA